jgi:hypothetical protein
MAKRAERNWMYEKSDPVDPLKSKVECCELPSGNQGEIHYIPRLNLVVGVNPDNEQFPLEFLEKLDGSLSFHYSPTPVATVATKHGDLIMSTAGIHLPPELQKKQRTKVVSWNDVKSVGQLITNLTYTDAAFQQAVQFVPAGIASILDPCGVFRESLDTFLDIPRTIEECTEQFIPAVYQTVDQTAECIAEAGRTLGDCKGDCRSGWRGAWCKTKCYAAYSLDVAWCIAHGIVTILVEAAHTVWNCVVRRGRVEGPPQTGDIMLFEPDSPEGYAIDLLTCGYGYSHAALVCGEEVIHSIGEGVVQEPINNVEDRDHIIIRLGLTDDQNSDLCECTRSQIGEDYDYIEAITFGTIDDPGREICTMLIMHCLDRIGVDRSALGLGGFVSPNDLARSMDAPQALFA